MQSSPLVFLSSLPRIPFLPIGSNSRIVAIEGVRVGRPAKLRTAAKRVMRFWGDVTRPALDSLVASSQSVQVRGVAVGGRWDHVTVVKAVTNINLQ